MANPPTKRRKPRARAASTAEIGTGTARSTHWMTAGVLALYVFASIISFVGLVAVGTWFLPSYLAWSVVGMVDLAIIIYKFGEIKLRQDPRKMHLAYKAKAGVLLGTTLSSIGNVIHIIDVANPEPVQYWGSMMFAGLSPWAIYLAASVLTDIVVRPKPRKITPVVEMKPAPKKRAPRKAIAQTPEPIEEAPDEVSVDGTWPPSFVVDRQAEVLEKW